MIRAKVTGWSDSRDADRFEDEDGFEWEYFVDAMDGTIAVQRTDREQAGVFTWELEGEAGWIAVAKDGDHYGVNCTEEFAVSGGEWCLTETLGLD
jgi:hypothetical protein